jgi:hypothetical protein
LSDSNFADVGTTTSTVDCRYYEKVSPFMVGKDVQMKLALPKPAVVMGTTFLVVQMQCSASKPHGDRSLLRAGFGMNVPGYDTTSAQWTLAGTAWRTPDIGEKVYSGSQPEKVGSFYVNKLHHPFSDL